MNDPIDRKPRSEAVDRRRRMSRRSASRRLSRAAIAGMMVLGTAALFRPEADERSHKQAENHVPGMGFPVMWAELESGMSYRRPTPAAGPRNPGTVETPTWRPVADVLKRKRQGEGISVFGMSRNPLNADEADKQEQLGRWHQILAFSSQYRIKTDLSRRIYDAAVTAGIEPELAFRVVRVESVFNPRAASPAGAVGLTQLMPATARIFEPDVTRDELFDPDTNLRIGFRYLRTLIRQYKGDLKLALLVYNRGPAAVQAALAMGVSPANGYETIITRGYRGRGTLD